MSGEGWPRAFGGVSHDPSSCQRETARGGPQPARAGNPVLAAEGPPCQSQPLRAVGRVQRWKDSVPAAARVGDYSQSTRCAEAWPMSKVADAGVAPRQRAPALKLLRNRKMARSAFDYVRGGPTKFYEWLAAIASAH
jgi:hypothetical protein